MSANQGQNDTKVQVYDVPTRLFHIIFAGLFASAFLIAKTVDDESTVFSFHMMLGLALAFAACLRIFWGFFGSTYARFSSFQLSPLALVNYFKNMLSGPSKRDGERELGHNPASSWAALVMLALALGLAATGVLMAQGGKETYEDLHELFGNAFLLVVLAHIGGVVLHTLRHRDGIAMSMVSGMKSAVVGAADGKNGIQRTYPLMGVAFIALMVTFATFMTKGFDPTTKQLTLFGSSLQLGENENGEKREGGGAEKHDHNDDDD